jgi:hypothetical protein
MLPSKIAIFMSAWLLIACLSVGAGAEILQPFRDTSKRDGSVSPLSAGMRIVWVQDAGDGGDPFGAGGNLRLMGLDTADRAGERAILPTVGSYVRPLITPKGDRVVYSDRIRKKVVVVNWNGTGLREIVSGFALAVWMDQRDGREWVYFGEENWGPDRDHTTEVYRMPLDGSGSRELVWNRTPVMVVGFQLSLDGQRASGNFPWPDGGVADLPNRGLKKLAKGCWTSLSGSKKPLFWIFDGAHRNLTLVNPEKEKKWQININSAPGIGGHEVYHPRWSNDPRIMAMTGPYKVGSGGNRIAGGGREVEIYVGRFNADFTAIESWWQATRNDRADFFPDVWVAPSGGAEQKPAKIPEGKKPMEDKSAVGVSSKAAKPGPSTAAIGKTPRKTIQRLVVEARLMDSSAIPAPRDIAPYRRALLVNGYDVVRVISGSYRSKKIMAAHWVIEEGQVLTDAIREKGKTYRMVLEHYDDHPELEGERLIMDSDEFKLTLFYELRQ